MADHPTKTEAARHAPDAAIAEGLSEARRAELAIVAGIKRGIADMEAGRVTPHDEVMRQIREIIDRAQSDQRPDEA